MTEDPAPKDATVDQPSDVPTFEKLSGNRVSPLTKKGISTRAALVAAARTVFERDGFIASRLSDITKMAGVSIGTFWTYFESKEEVFAAVLHGAQEDMLHPSLPRVAESENPKAVISASNKAYLVAYKRNGRLMQLMIQVATINPEFQALRTQRSYAFATRNARSIAELQARGLVYPDLDPFMTSWALSSMVSRMALDHLVVGDREVDEILPTINQLWYRGLGLDQHRGNSSS